MLCPTASHNHLFDEFAGVKGRDIEVETWVSRRQEVLVFLRDELYG